MHAHEPDVQALKTGLAELRAEVAQLRDDLALLRRQVEGHFDQHHAAVRPSVSR